ncbi:uncharacterized protein LOC127872906 isoform X2 [Dreissena polymorpha]|uniref:uncharacterized protein LOC127872906 isoform X2 n=1 Tax=Dreissena polymorpha TaxID=45954 RepID=UPI002263D933|nr:uncharacterized protein LOC127872906 isoform X2 [Dreissena polymorpha]XP_052272384.1 uncharacterized protein LOC127872906 isoform X2 [Dreissena polymorpha]
MQENCPSFLDSSNSVGDGPAVEDNGSIFANILDSLDQDNHHPPTLSAFDNLDFSDMYEVGSGDEQMLEYLCTTKPKLKKTAVNNQREMTAVLMANDLYDSENSNTSSRHTRRMTRHSQNCTLGNEVVATSNSDKSINDANTIVIDARTLMNKSRNSHKSKSYRDCSYSDLSDNENKSTRTDRCMSKNAITARINRQKQKERYESLQTELAESIEENTNLKKELLAKNSTINNLSREVQYLRSVLANQSCIANIIKQMPSVPGMYFLVNNDMSNKVDVNDNDVSERLNKKPSQKRNFDSAGFEVFGSSKITSANEDTKITAKGVYVVASGSKKSKTDVPPSTSVVPNLQQDICSTASLLDENANLKTMSDKNGVV